MPAELKEFIVIHARIWLATIWSLGAVSAYVLTPIILSPAVMTHAT